MSIPALDEQFLPRLISVFYAVFHPTEGPKVIYQVPEGSITEEQPPSKPDAASSSTNDHASSSKPPPPPPTATGGTLGGEPLFNFSALSEYFIPKAPLCGRLVTSIARGTVGVRQRDHERASRAPSVAAGPRSGSRHSGGESGPNSRASSARRRAPGDEGKTDKPQREQRSYKILGFPTLIEDAEKYQRNNFIFNLCFVFEGSADVRAYEPIVRKCGRLLRGLEESQSFLTSPKSRPRVYGIMEQLFEDLNSYCETFIALPEAPHTSYLKNSSKPNSPESNNLVSPVIGPDDIISLGASFASLRGEHHRNLINERLKQKQMQQAAQMSSPRQSQPHSSTSIRRSPSQQNLEGLRSRSTSASGSSLSDARGPLSPLTTMTTVRSGPQPLVRSNSATGMSGLTSGSPISPTAAGAGLEGRRPSIFRASTVLALADEPSQGAFPSEESRDTAMGIVTSRGQSELSRELSAAESLGNVLTSADSGAYDSINTAAGTRRSSRGSTAGAPPGEHDVTSLEQLTESVLSLRTIDAALSNSVNALRTETADTSKRTALVEKREPPHGLGRTVRDAINLKLFPVYPNPQPINDWDVPVALLDLNSRLDGNWDLTLRRILPFIDGVNHVKRIAQLADADIGLTTACLEHLVYYGCIITIDIFQYFNIYTVRPAIAKMADDEALGRECVTYVTRPGYAPLSWPALLKLYSLLRAGTTLHDWIEENSIDDKGVDVRRFVSFGVIQGFLRRVHRYPVYLGTRSGDEGFSRFDTSVVSTVRNSPVINSPAAIKPESERRDQSGSREPRDRRPRELSGMSGFGGGAYSAFQRVGRDGSVDSPGVGMRGGAAARKGTGATSEARLSNIVLQGGSVSGFAGAGGSNASASNLGDSAVLLGSGGGSAFGTSPGKRHSRMQRRPNYRHPTTTAVDVAAAAFNANDNERPAAALGSANTNARSPRKRASIALGTTIPSAGSAGGAHAHSSTTPAAQIPPELVDMLDGLHSDDEICVRFGIAWPELEKWLVQIGFAHEPVRASAHGNEGGDTDDDELAARSDWRRWPANPGGSMFSTAQGASSGWSKGKVRGMSGVASSNRTGGTGGTQGGESSGFAWGVDADESGIAAAAGAGAVDRDAVEAGDLGRVKILYQ